MLDGNGNEQSAARLIASLPCHVQIPAQLRDGFETSGSAPVSPDCRRQFARLRCRSTSNRAGVQCQRTFPSLNRGDTWRGVYLADISRTGLQIIHSEQLYPGENVRVIAMTGAVLEVEVVRCRRLGEACFSIGARFQRDAEK